VKLWGSRLYRFCKVKVRVSDRDSADKVRVLNRVLWDRDSADKVRVLNRVLWDRDNVDKARVLNRAQQDQDSAAVDKVAAAVLCRAATPTTGSRVREHVAARVRVLVEPAEVAVLEVAAVETNSETSGGN